MTTPGDRRPREGRCERCDLPLCVAIGADDCPGGVCHLLSGGECESDPIDWRTRALAAEDIAARVDESLRNGWIDRTLAAELDRRVERAHVEGTWHGLLVGAWVVQASYDAAVEAEARAAAEDALRDFCRQTLAALEDR